MPVNSRHKLYDQYIPDWRLCRDVANGEKAVKARGTTYLPGFVPQDETRYEQYKQRAQFVNFTARTLNGLVGAIFRKEPEHELPSQIEYLLENADGNGLSLSQLTKAAAGEVMTTGRVGVLVDYPEAPEGLSQEDVDRLNLQCSFSLYAAESIINWQTIKIGGVSILSLVVMIEDVEKQIDAFATEPEVIYRVLRFDEDGNYIQQVYDEGGMLQSTSMPRQFNGAPFRYIPFVFIGADDNRVGPDKPPLIDMATVNIGHYRNSADFEEGVFVHGQGTLFVSSDMSVDQWTAANPNGVTVGARRGHFLGGNGNAVLLQALPNNIAREAMKDKEAQLISIGAKLIQKSGPAETAEAVKIQAAGEASALSTITGNLSEGFEQALEYACDYMGGDKDAVIFKLNQEFFPETMSAQDVMAFIQLADRGDIAQSDVRAKLRKAGWIDSARTDDEIDEEAEDVGGLNATTLTT